MSWWRPLVRFHSASLRSLSQVAYRATELPLLAVTTVEKERNGFDWKQLQYTRMWLVYDLRRCRHVLPTIFNCIQLSCFQVNVKSDHGICLCYFRLQCDSSDVGVSRQECAEACHRLCPRNSRRQHSWHEPQTAACSRRNADQEHALTEGIVIF